MAGNDNKNDITLLVLILLLLTTNERSFKVFNPVGIKFLARLRVGLSHLIENKFKHNFQSCLNSLRFCSLEVNRLFTFSCITIFLDKFRQTFLETVEKIINDISHLNDDLKQLMYGSPSYSFEENNKIINASIKYCLDTEKFSGPLIEHYNSDLFSFTL